MPWLAAIGAIAAPVIGGAMGQAAAASDRDASRSAANAAFNQLNGVGIPEDIAKEIILKQFQQNGTLTPELEQEIKAGPSAFQDLTVSDAGRSAQLEALQAMQQVGKTGMRPEDMAALNQIRQKMAQDTEAKRQQIIQNYQQRGLGGSGAELASQLQASQAGSNEASRQGDDLAAQASQRALQALQASGSMGNQLQSQDNNLAALKAQAADEFRKFDTQNAMARQQRNTTAQNAAQAANLSRQQGVADTNTTQANAEKQRQVNAKQQLYQDQLGLAQSKANAMFNQATNLQNLGNQTAQNYANIGSGVGSGLGAIYAQANKSSGTTPTPKSNSFDYDGNGDLVYSAHGGKVPGVPLVPGDSEINDTKHYMLSPDEVILPASIAKSDKLHEIHTFLRNLEMKDKK